jgi:hypothetical protein
LRWPGLTRMRRTFIASIRNWKRKIRNRQKITVLRAGESWYANQSKSGMKRLVAEKDVISLINALGP